MPPDLSELSFLGSVSADTVFRLLDGAPDALLLVDAEGAIRFVNAQAERLFGFARQELLGKPLEVLVPERYREAHVHSRNRYMSGPTLRPMGLGLELYGCRKDGSEFPVEISLSPIETSHGRLVASSVRDITQRKRAELDTNLLAAIVGSSDDAIVSIGLEGAITSWNGGAAHIFGYGAAEVLGKPLALVGGADDDGGWRELLARVHRGEYVRQPHMVRRHKDGHEVHLAATLSPLRDGRGNVVGASMIARDITEQKQMEANAELLHQRLRSAVESIQGMFALFDGDDRLVLCNSEFRQFFDRPRSGSIAGRPFAQLVEDGVGQGVFEVGEQGGDALAARWRAYHGAPSGTLDLRTTEGHTLRVADRPTAEGGIVTTIWDITEDVQREDELRQARAVSDAASAAKSEFLSSMSHELRTPLNAILGFAQLLLRDKKVPPTERQRERLGHILKGGEHLLRLIDDVLDLSRIEAGRLTISLEAVSVADVLAEVERTLEPMAARADVRLALSPVPPDAARVRADRTRFAQVLINYGSNAIKYGGSGGTVSFQVSHPSEGMVRLCVSDMGQGIPLDKQDKLFQPFQRAGQELGPIEGTGIGLTICKRVAELMGGSVGFRSAPSAGSHFWIDLPVFHAQEQAPVAARASRDEASPLADRGGARHCVLYVEDNPSNIVFMRDLMEDFDGIELVVAPTAEIGLEIARVRMPEVVIMDINLPGMNGIEAAEQLRAWPETSAIPIVALSAAAMKTDRQRAQTAVFHRYLTKPVQVDELMETLEPLLAPPS